jgi:RNA polymerase sigma factor (sigma-70 family)
MVPVRPDAAEDHLLLWELVRQLPTRQRAVLVLRYYEDMSESETADVLGLSRGTVKSHTSRGLAALRGKLSDAPVGRK